jgi:Right handed beta helix region
MIKARLQLHRFSFAALSFLSIALTANAAAFHVSPKGDDTADGSEQHPFATLARAQQAVRAGSGDSEVWLEDGTYAINKTLDFDAADRTVTFRARHDGKAVLDAAVHIEPKAWRPSQDPRLPAEARGKVFELDLATAGLTHVQAFPDRFNDGGGLIQLFFDGVWQPLSRWPNEHNTKMKKVLDRGDDPGAPGKRPGTFVYDEDRPQRWKAAADAGQLWLAGFWRVAWDWTSVRVKTMDVTQKSIALAAPVGGGIGSKYAGPEGAGTEPWRAINLVEEIDMPGEWAVDFIAHKLFFWPPQDLGKATVTVADFADPIVRMKKAAHVTLRGLVLRGSLGNGVEITDGEGCTIAGCTLTQLGKNGVVIKNGTKHRVVGCDLHSLGHGGILLGGGDRATLTPCGHVADNNHIHHYALAKKIWSPGIAVGANDAGYACGCVVTHNLVHDSPHAAILYGGNDHRLELNEVHDFLIESDDLGGFYTNNGWASYGNVLKNNFIHHTGHALGIYLDDGDSGDTLEGNLMYRMGTGAAVGGGHDNILRGNVAIECPGGFGIDARGVSRKYDKDSGMLKDFVKIKVDSAPWSDRFPMLQTLLKDHPELPLRCVIEGNVVVGTEKKAEMRGKPEQFKVVTVKNNAALSIDDLGFSNAAKLDFRMKPDAPVFAKVPGFQAIPFEKIGLYTDELRPVLPKHPSGHTSSEWHREK